MRFIHVLMHRHVSLPPCHGLLKKLFKTYPHDHPAHHGRCIPLSGTPLLQYPPGPFCLGPTAATPSPVMPLILLHLQGTLAAVRVSRSIQVHTAPLAAAVPITPPPHQRLLMVEHMTTAATGICPPQGHLPCTPRAVSIHTASKKTQADTAVSLKMVKSPKGLFVRSPPLQRSIFPDSFTSRTSRYP